MLGGILRMKGTLTFLRAAERIASENADAFFAVAGPAYATGNAQEHQHYRSCIEALQRLGEKHQGCYLGTVSNAGSLIGRSAIVVAPSRESHFSRPIIEAWAAGKPVVACRTPHMEDLVTDAIDGILVPVDDEVALCESLRVLLADPALRHRLGSAGQEKVRARFDAGANTSRIVDLCLGLMSKPGGIR
jgi:glycosyltransferase involved in cell wall biosynthesis